MAIVKFVSDKTCQIFIDKEFSGEVDKDSILKLLLESGGYLVEVKDKDANIRKKYNLEIKATDTQVLQDVSDGDSSLDAVIDQLRNDPSLEFHCDRASFCHNGLYGYVNKRFEVVIPAIYTVANKFEDDKAFVVREFPDGKKTTLIDEDGNMFFNRWFDYIGESEETILLGIENRIIVYSKLKYDKIVEYYYAGYDHKASLVPVYKKVGNYDFYGYIDYDGNEVIPFIFNNAGNFDENGEADVNFLGRDVKINRIGYYRQGENGYYYRTSWDSDLQGLDGIINENINCSCSYDTGETCWNFLPIWNSYKWIIRVSVKQKGTQKELKTIDYQCDYVLGGGAGYWILKTGEKVLTLIANVYIDGIEEFTFDADDVEPVFDINHNLQGDDIITSRTFIIRRSNKYGVYNTLGEVLIPVEYDEIKPLESFKFAVKKANKYRIYSAGKLSAFEYDNVTKCINSNNDYSGLLLEKAGKYGLWKSSNVIPPIYDYIESCNSCCADRNIVSLNGKYGIIDDKQKEILSINYEKIIPLGESYFKVKTDKGWSLGLVSHGIVYPTIFDDISLISENTKRIDNIFLVKEGNKYGCINNHGEILIPIKYNKIVLDSDYYPTNVSFRIYLDDKVGFGELFTSIYLVKSKEYIYYVEPIFDECVLLRNGESVLDSFNMPYAAVREEMKWGILDQKPRSLTYKAIEYNLEDECNPNYDDLIFRYNSIEELKNDADNEFQRRYNKYFQPWDLNKDEDGNYRVVKKENIEISPIKTEEENLGLSETYSDEELLNAWTDEYGAKYTPDRKKLISGANCKEYTVAYGTKIICYYSFAHSCTEQVTIPDTVIYIAEEAFFLSKIKKINIPDSVKAVGCEAFFESDISFISWSNTMSVIARMTFSGCQKLYEINIPSNIIKIDEFAFERCEFLRDVKLNEGLKSIGKGAFCNCSRLKKLTIPFSVSSIGSNPFLGCVCDIECLSPHFTIKNGMLFTSDMKRVISCLLNSGEIDIPEGVEIIGGSSFNSGITSISIPNTVKMIGEDAFSTTSLKTITIPKSVQKIERYALRNCKDLKEIRILNKNIVIEEGFVENCESLEVILIPKGAYSYFFDLFEEWWIRDILVEGTKRSFLNPKDATYISEQLHKNTMFRHPINENT